MRDAYLVLETGEVFRGEGFGAAADSVGELVFCTGAAGYSEMLTDPGYRGQILMFTFPAVGNCGMTEEDFESPFCHARGVVARGHCETPSNFRCGETLDAFLKRFGVPGISGVDTRAVTGLIRERGVTNAKICSSPPDGVPPELKKYRVENPVAATGAAKIRTLLPEGRTVRSVALIDYGAKRSMLGELLSRGCKVTVFPPDSGAGDVLASGPDGIMLSGGPGDPADGALRVREIRELLGKKPIFGVGLGHQLLALAAGGATVKLKCGHRGSNLPVRELRTGRVYITSQNHGYAVSADSLPGTGAELSHVSLNDETCEGLVYPGLVAFSLQFHPEPRPGSPGPGSAYDSFMEMMGGKPDAAR